MSRLNELIQELCPNGIEYKMLGGIATISREAVSRKKILQNMVFPVYIMGKFIRDMVWQKIKQ